MDGRNGTILLSASWLFRRCKPMLFSEVGSSVGSEGFGLMVGLMMAVGSVVGGWERRLFG